MPQFADIDPLTGKVRAALWPPGGTSGYSGYSGLQ